MRLLQALTARSPLYGLAFILLASCETATGPEQQPPEVINGWADLTAGEAHTCGLLGDGRLFCWGNNELGQLGDGTTVSSTLPSEVSLPPGLVVAALEASGRRTCILGTDGSVYCWGENLRGELGNGTTDDSSVPMRVVSTTNFEALTVGSHHACALDANGAAYCWGGGIRTPGGDLALGFDPPDVCLSNSYFSTRCSTVPRAVPTALRFDAISAGLFQTCGRDPNGTGHCWGWNRFGQLGDGTSAPTAGGTLVPVAVGGGVSFASLDAGSLHGCGIAAGGAAYCWGSEAGGTPNQWNLGQLGAGEAPNAEGSATPRPVVGGLNFMSLTTNAENNVRALHTCGIVTTNDVYCWGANGQNQLGAPAPGICAAISNMMIPCVGTPQRVGGDLQAVAIQTGMFFTCAIGMDREMYCWGMNDSGQFGNATQTSSGTPIRVTMP